jgi:hypothetical protein
MVERGAATKGRMAKTVSGADDVELKATIPHKQIHWGLRRYSLSADNDQERHIFFFDTPGLDLFHSGVVLRARRIIGGAHDSTVKLRPVDPAKVPAKWKKYAGFKIEADASENGVVKSASLTMPVAKGVIKRVAAGELGVAALLTDEQKTFLLEMARLELDLSRLLIMGPMQAQRWKFSDPALPWPITAELWRRDDGETIFEASIKAPVQQAAVAAGGFLAHLAEIGAERDHAQEAKTRWALEHYAGRARATTSKPAVVAAAKAKASTGSSKSGASRRKAKTGATGSTKTAPVTKSKAKTASGKRIVGAAKKSRSARPKVAERNAAATAKKKRVKSPGLPSRGKKKVAASKATGATKLPAKSGRKSGKK